MKELMSVQEVLSCLRISSSTLREWDRKKVLPATRNQFGWRLYKEKDVFAIKSKIQHGRLDGKKLRQESMASSN